MKTTKINFDLLGFMLGILIFMTFAMWFMGCCQEVPKTEETPANDTFIHPDSNIAAEMKIAAEFDSLKYGL